MRPRADDPSLDRVRTGTPQSTAARSSWALVSESSVVAHLAQSLESLLAFFADLLGSDPSLDFGVGNVGWEVAGEPLANVGRGLEQVGGGPRTGVPPWGGGATEVPLEGGGGGRRGVVSGKGEGGGIVGRPERGQPGVCRMKWV